MRRQEPRVTSKSAATTAVLLNDLINHPTGTVAETSNTSLFLCIEIHLAPVSKDRLLSLTRTATNSSLIMD